jgi:hypothetical protein
MGQRVPCEELQRRHLQARRVDAVRAASVYLRRVRCPRGGRAVKQPITALIAGGILAFVAPLAASRALAAQDYPPGLFENSPVVPSGPPDAAVPSQPSDAAEPLGPPDAVDPLDDYCDGLASRTFRSLAEVKRAHAKCDHAHGVEPLWPPAEDQSDE